MDILEIRFYQGAERVDDYTITMHDNIKNMPITEVEGLSARTIITLHRAGVYTIGDLHDERFKSMDNIFKVRNLGAKALEEILTFVPRYFPVLWAEDRLFYLQRDLKDAQAKIARKDKKIAQLQDQLKKATKN